MKGWSFVARLKSRVKIQIGAGTCLSVEGRMSESSVDRNQVRVNLYDPCMRSLIVEKYVYNYARRFALMCLFGIPDK